MPPKLIPEFGAYPPTSIPTTFCRLGQKNIDPDRPGRVCTFNIAYLYFKPLDSLRILAPIIVRCNVKMCIYQSFTQWGKPKISTSSPTFTSSRVPIGEAILSQIDVFKRTKSHKGLTVSIDCISIVVH